MAQAATPPASIENEIIERRVPQTERVANCKYLEEQYIFSGGEQQQNKKN